MLYLTFCISQIYQKKIEKEKSQAAGLKNSALLLCAFRIMPCS